MGLSCRKAFNMLFPDNFYFGIFTSNLNITVRIQMSVIFRVLKNICFAYLNYSLVYRKKIIHGKLTSGFFFAYCFNFFSFPFNMLCYKIHVFIMISYLSEVLKNYFSVLFINFRPLFSKLKTMNFKLLCIHVLIL